MQPGHSLLAETDPLDLNHGPPTPVESANQAKEVTDLIEPCNRQHHDL